MNRSFASSAGAERRPRTLRARERRQKVLDELAQQGEAGVERLCEIFHASPATIRRDLAELERRGRLRRTRGGAVAVEPLLYEPFRRDSTFREQNDRNVAAKRAIAEAAARLIQNGDTVMLNPGTTTTQIARYLPRRIAATLVTNAVNIAMEMSQRREVTVLMTGGYLHGGWFSLVGVRATEALADVYADKAFLGCNGIDIRAGLTAYHPEEAAIARVMLRQARQVIVVADATKYGVIAPYRIAGLGETNLLITNEPPPEEMRKALEAGKVEVQVAGPEISARTIDDRAAPG